MTYVIEITRNRPTYKYNTLYFSQIVGRRPTIGNLSRYKVENPWIGTYTFKRVHARDAAMKRIQAAKAKYELSWKDVEFTSYDVKETIPT